MERGAANGVRFPFVSGFRAAALDNAAFHEDFVQGSLRPAIELATNRVQGRRNYREPRQQPLTVPTVYNLRKYPRYLTGQRRSADGSKNHRLHSAKMSIVA